MNLLHLSDLHFGTPDNAAAWYSALAEDLKHNLNCFRIDVLIISGDIASTSIPEEYASAEMFLYNMMEEFGIDPSKIVIVPGNHDLNFEIADGGYKIYREKYLKDNSQILKSINLGNGYVRILENEEAHRSRFGHFSSFYKNITGKSYPLEYDEQGIIINHFQDERVIILGLNSCWRIDEDFPTDADINTNALGRSLDELRRHPERYERSYRFAVWHHPLMSSNEDRIKNLGFMEQLASAGFSIAFHGHIHKDDRFLYEYDVSPDGRKINVIGVGTFGAPSEQWWPGVPLQYNYMTLKENCLTLCSRSRKNPTGSWEAACIWRMGKSHDPSSHYSISLPCGEKTIEKSFPIEGKLYPEKNFFEIPERYKKWILDRCQYMDIDRLRERGSGIRLELPEIFIPLYAYAPIREEEHCVSVDRYMEPGHGEDIEDLIRRYNYLLIRGQAGSGKTTLIKHLAYLMIKSVHLSKNDVWNLPVLIFLKDLKGFSFEDKIPNAKSAEELLDFYFDRVQNEMTADIVKSYCRNGRTYFLLDGLDEIKSDFRDFIAHSLADFRHCYEGCHMVLSGRHHGVDGAVLDRFGDYLVTIHSLSMEQVENFIQKWFCYMENAEKGSCTKTAQEMIAELRAHPAISALKDTPLMLTAICLLYYDGKELPGQRPELYKKFVDNLLYRRFDDPEKVNRFLSNLAYTMHDQRDKGIDRLAAIDILSEVYIKKMEETEVDYLKRLEVEFDRIEPDCGLLVMDRGRYSFWHLTFQEFLTAKSLVDRERRDYFKAIENLWDDPWYWEVIQLYIGYLSIQNMMMANEIVKNVLEQKDYAPYSRWRLACQSLNGVHIDRRHSQVVDLAQKKLQFIMQSKAAANVRSDAGEILGWLGDHRNLEAFIPVQGGVYHLSQGEFKIEPFEIGKYPVTNNWFKEFLESGGYSNKSYWTKEGQKWLEHSKTKVPLYWFERPWNCPNKPVVGISWYEAVAFINWLNQKDKLYLYFLPSEQQWEAVASGLSNRKYPWGNQWSDDLCYNKESPLEKSSTVGIFKNGCTPDGVCDLMGNVLEWTVTDYYKCEDFQDIIFDPELHSLCDLWQKSSKEDRKEKLSSLLEKYLSDDSRQLLCMKGGSRADKKETLSNSNRYVFIPNYRGSHGSFRIARIPTSII